MAEPEALLDQLQRLHLQLPKLTFDPGRDTPGSLLPGADIYLDHYGLESLTTNSGAKLSGSKLTGTKQAGTQHFLGSTQSCGYTIACQYWLPAAPTGTVFVVHGYFDHVGLYGHLFQYLLNKNLAVVAFDLPGHGLSDGEQVSIASFDHYVEVFDSILDFATSHMPQPWHSVGQSTGGAIVLKHLLEEASDKHMFHNIALLAPLLHPYKWQSNRLVYLLAHRFLTRITRNFSKNSGNQHFVDFLAQHDPLQAQHIPLEWIGAMKRWTEEFHDLPCNDYPLHIIQGDCDVTLDWHYNLKRFRDKLPKANIHMVTGAQHHLVNETEVLRIQAFDAMGFDNPDQ
ncbi:MAG: alpha/beta hydrolase [Gammaproteobacteria bacterium]|nr:MAG: alpha/beta hydrolase [Gammaproteobacteria bacterium]RLA51009.1 MAG: alpha/beta hydrolase [Gammaproteobacteria bacterium]